MDKHDKHHKPGKTKVKPGAPAAPADKAAPETHGLSPEQVGKTGWQVKKK